MSSDRPSSSPSSASDSSARRDSRRRSSTVDRARRRTPPARRVLVAVRTAVLVVPAAAAAAAAATPAPAPAAGAVAVLVGRRRRRPGRRRPRSSARLGSTGSGGSTSAATGRRRPRRRCGAGGAGGWNSGVGGANSGVSGPRLGSAARPDPATARPAPGSPRPARSPAPGGGREQQRVTTCSAAFRSMLDWAVRTSTPTSASAEITSRLVRPSSRASACTRIFSGRSSRAGTGTGPPAVPAGESISDIQLLHPRAPSWEGGRAGARAVLPAGCAESNPVSRSAPGGGRCRWRAEYRPVRSGPGGNPVWTEWVSELASIVEQSLRHPGGLRGHR